MRANMTTIPTPPILNTNLISEVSTAGKVPPTPLRITRDGDLDLVFRGWKVASGTCGDRESERDWTRWTEVTLYVSDTGRLVCSVQRHSKWQGQGSRYEASSHTSFAEVIRELRDGEGRLGPASKLMVEEAANFESLADEDVERL